MPTMKNRTKPSAGESGLSTETTSGGQTSDHSMNLDESSVAAGALPRQETPAEKGDAVLKAFDELYGGDIDPLPKDSGAIDVDKVNEEEDVFLLPESQNFIPGTAEDFTEKLRFNGLGDTR